ncbi:atl1 [Candida oxycetoniae]|uniref:6-O-methylguanine-DNA methyltransferase n=1 Tax=Candida oxycetoniae TaxID=497107 RepID=A0AAI9X0B4_9ASCO|nr:atl1 [Candida oxycetoniae]KAI3406954.2 atl1 [Candida oxycetoniae]
MKLTDESRAFHFGVYTIVFQIPYGKVTTYGHIAYLLDKPANSRQVGSSLKHCAMIFQDLNQGYEPDDENFLQLDELPWWRVVSSSGKISPRENSHGQYIQAELLRQEGISVSETHLVNLDAEEVGWFPEEVNL